MSSTYAAFLVALKLMESGGDYQSVNTLNYLGAYQFGEAALTDLGYVRYDGDAFDNNYSGGFTGKDGVRSVQDFLNSARAQDRAAQEWMRLMWSYIEMYNIDHYAGREVGGQTLTVSGMLAATHLLGPGALKEYIDSDGKADLRDPYGTPIVQYINQFGGYEVPFVRVRVAQNS
ncbi:hypothetical protein EU803_04860 [Loktanella sp. IMCC34160]|uniref:hypothetical protein n=1 Tax=Loktanella sp. IMCC34160 TaxID=2510646 RepID=UPI00101C4DF5|nr:hypothetical protein [Loktanella sp. IMCC34160]RYG91792.1 hypothetical protein EU803_04860 [Loktanella sp. IMCC34160]